MLLKKTTWGAVEVIWVIFVVVLVIVVTGSWIVLVDMVIVFVVVVGGFVVVFQRSLVPVFVRYVLVHVIAVMYFVFAGSGLGSGPLRRRQDHSKGQFSGGNCSSTLSGSSFTPINPEGAGTVTEGGVTVEVEVGTVIVVVVMVSVA
ncbi:hypothetical protein AA313_de0201218 [Arthrobotrys entomopaga]|nr:hypothetical protein AA313_de0201218 [Arthrobotrys entomopaga]